MRKLLLVAAPALALTAAPRIAAACDDADTEEHAVGPQIDIDLDIDVDVDIGGPLYIDFDAPEAPEVPDVPDPPDLPEAAEPEDDDRLEQLRDSLEQRIEQRMDRLEQRLDELSEPDDCDDAD